MTRQPTKFFNFLIPYNQYEELRNLGIETNRPIAEIVRQGINIVLKSEALEASKHGQR